MRRHYVQNSSTMRRQLFVIGLLLLLVACSPTPSPDPTLTPTPTSEPVSDQPIDDLVQAAFADSDLEMRRSRVLTAVQRFLADPSVQSVSDTDASTRLTDLAFASGAMRLTDPAYIRRHEAIALVALPDGLGLYFFAPTQPPLEINRYTIGLITLNPVWREAQIGIPYETLGTDGAITSQFSLLTYGESGWQIAWTSVDTPDWWFNARNGSLTIEPDLSRITMIGQAPGATLVFNESGAAVQREFRLAWLHNEESQTYEPDPPSALFGSREAWLWHIAVPSPYATLVEFIERLQRDNDEGLLRLVLNGEVVEDARDFGFSLINQSYDVILNEADRVVIRGHQGVFEFAFTPPDSEGDPYVITRIIVGGGQ